MDENVANWTKICRTTVTQRAKQSSPTKRALKNWAFKQKTGLDYLSIVILFDLTFLWQVFRTGLLAKKKYISLFSLTTFFCFMQRCRGKKTGIPPNNHRATITEN